MEGVDVCGIADMQALYGEEINASSFARFSVKAEDLVDAFDTSAKALGPQRRAWGIHTDRTPSVSSDYR